MLVFIVVYCYTLNRKLGREIKGKMAKKHNLIDKLDKFIGDRLYITRVSQGLTRQSLAKEIGVSHQQLLKYEKGTNRISAGRLLLISYILKKPVSYFYDEFDKNSDMSYEDCPINNRMSLEFSKNFTKLKNLNHRNAVNNLVKSLIKISE